MQSKVKTLTSQIKTIRENIKASKENFCNNPIPDNREMMQKAERLLHVKRQELKQVKIKHDQQKVIDFKTYHTITQNQFYWLCSLYDENDENCEMDRYDFNVLNSMMDYQIKHGKMSSKMAKYYWDIYNKYQDNLPKQMRGN